MKGDKGEKGTVGLKGMRGPKGDNGTVGDEGYQGPPGDEGNITCGFVIFQFGSLTLGAHAHSTWFVCLSVYVSTLILALQATRHKGYQWLQNYVSPKNKSAILLKRLCSRVINWYGRGPRCVAQPIN